MKIKQYDDYETSTRVCPCGQSFTWSAFDDRLESWMRDHAPHADGFEAVVTEDGKRASS